jgi:superfamily II DNA/RNA helicase
MHHNIFDNRKNNLIDALKQKIVLSSRADFVVGWFFLTGLKELKDEFEHLDKLRILAGSRTNRATAEIMLLSEKYTSVVSKIIEDLKFPNEAKIQDILTKEADAMVRHISTIKPTQENIDFIKWFWQKLNDSKIEIRLYPKETLHAKLYLLHYFPQESDKGVAFVGSSNLSISGISLNTELNVLLPEKENHKYLSKWFEELWQDSERADFTQMLAKSIKQSWVMNQDKTPFRIYLRLLHEIFSIEDYAKAPEISKKIGEVELYDFQLDAIRDAYLRLQKYNGIFLADVPGLGKTYMGAGLLSHLQEENKRAIIIGPPKLRENWEEVLSQFNVGTARFFSLGKLEEIINDDRLMARDVILIDESHHFRNPDSQRYKDMEIVCEGKQVILVGATPQNLSIWDLYNQIKLFTPSESFHQFRIDPPDMKDFFKKCDDGNANLENLIDQIIIRRTRKDIKELYKHEDLKFPRRRGPYRVEYSIDEVYSGGLYKRLNWIIDNFTFARYDVGSYIKAGAFTPDDAQRIKIAGKNLKKIMRIILFRRLESSVAALRDSARWMRKSQEAFLQALAQEKVLVGDAADEVYEQIRGGADPEDIEVPATAETANKFNIISLKNDIEKDLLLFEELEEIISEDNIPPSDDDKLLTLINYLKKPEINGKKTIIFTQFASTAKYLGKELKELFPKVDYVTQGTGQVLTKAYRFSPKSNNKRVTHDEEINILVSTEILSEGLNLQDGQIVINYELHWNPVRIIQRIGRIDRIGSEHDEIYVYNFFPQEEVEKEIRVEEKVNKRIKEIIDFYGADEKTINMAEDEVRKRLFKIYTEDERSLEEEEIISTSHEFRQKWQKLRDEYPEEYAMALTLPDMIGTGLKTNEEGVAVFCRADDYFRLMLSNIKGDILQRDDWKVLPLLECSPDEQNEPIAENHYDITEKARELFEDEANKRELKRHLLDKLREQAIDRLDFIKRGKSPKFKERVGNLISKIQTVQIKTIDKKKVRSQLRKYGIDPEELVSNLENLIYALPDEKKPDIKRRYAQVILSESLYKNG